jgi:hypothetical protein
MATRAIARIAMPTEPTLGLLGLGLLLLVLVLR